ncbi:hypothetical protein [Sedimentibacter sp. MB31-C6]|uniref:hypothetical protein n=1 Tax=Sedimentibacter sp. MB31-C6 TaxID=3109366 RepID=UPI002DDC9AFA|nr:hypothetical protein [Sedimentibacter sp. MB36-C1]WSI04033.1 hypothetical protein U8307_13685 [Sedimentibacter sp. MB36-C1]
MKRVIKLIIVGLLVFSFAVVFANSGPVYMTGLPSSGVLAVDKNTPIEVKKENLTFDFSGEEEHYAPIGIVTAEYEMVNPTTDDLSVQMAFPYIGNLGSASNDNIKIIADNEELPYEIYLGETVKSKNGFKNSEETEENYFDFEEIIDAITNDIYIAENFTENEIGKLYSIKVTPESDEGVEIFVDLTFDHNKTKIFTTGFRGLSRAGEKTIIHGWCREQSTLNIFVLGDDIDFTIEGYTDGTRNEKTSLYKYEISETEEDVKTNLLDNIRKNSYVSYDDISDIQLYNVFAKVLDEQFSNNLGYCSDDEALSYGGTNRMIILFYNVEFPQNSEKTVSVSYQTDGTMDRRKTKEPVYTYDYILNPAKNWNDFKNLNIKIIPPEESPFVVESSIELNKEGNTYTASIKSLPDDDFSFTIYHRDKVTMMDMVEKEISNVFGFFFMFSPFILIFVFIIVIILIFTKGGKKKI